MVKTRQIEKEKSKNSMKHKIRKCTVVLTRLNVENLTFRKALFRMHGVRDLRVKLDRLISEAVTPSTPKLVLLPAPNVKSVRSLVPWLPKTPNSKSSTFANMKTEKTPILKPLAGEREVGLSLRHDQLDKNIVGSDTMNDDEASTSQKGEYISLYMYNM